MGSWGSGVSVGTSRSWDAPTSAGPIAAAPAGPRRSATVAGPVAAAAPAGPIPTAAARAAASAIYPSAAAAAPTRPAPVAPTNIQTQRPPELDFSIENLKKLLAGGPEEQRSIDRLGSSMREFASRGKQALTPGQVARGVSGTGVANRQYSNVEDKANQLFAGGSADIEMDRLDKRHGVLRDIAGLGTTAASIAQGDRAAALSQYDRQLDAWRAESANAMAQKNAQLSELSTIVNLMGGMNPSYAGVF